MAKIPKFKLKDRQTTFYDPETKLKVTGSDEVEIDPKGRGKLTLSAINAGGLIEVSVPAAKESGDKAKGSKPNDKSEDQK